MRIYRNTGYIDASKRRAKLMAAGGFALLIATFPVAFFMSSRNNNFIFVTYIFLVIGFILFNRGMQRIGRWGNNARHIREDFALDNHLKALSDKYTLIHFGRPLDKVIDHSLVHPGGVLVITTKDFPGQVRVDNDVWRKSGSVLGRMFAFSGPQVGNPTKETGQALDNVEAALRSAELEADFEGVIVFTTSTAEIEVDGSSDPVIPVEELEAYIRDLEPEVELSTQERDAIVALLAKGEQVEEPIKTTTRRPVKVKKRAAS
jgi:hypothetical protein